jgi:NAD+ diphosphatase
MEDIYCFGGNPLDRASERRGDREWIAKLLADPNTRILALRDLKPFTRGTGTPALDWQPVAQWRDQIDAGSTLLFLGLGDGRAHFAIDATGTSVASDIDTKLVDVRALAPAIATGEAAILAEARSLLDWHSRHRFCARCGSATRVASAGWVRRCPDCRASHFPRTDPVVIMLAIHGDRPCSAAIGARGRPVFVPLPASSSREKRWRRRCAARYARSRGSAAAAYATWRPSRGRFPRAS